MQASSMDLISANTCCSGSGHSNRYKLQLSELIVECQQQERPRKPLSAYNIFFKENRQEVLDSRRAVNGRNLLPKIGFAELARTIASRWRAASPEIRKIYEDKAKLDRERYIRDEEEWELNNLYHQKFCKFSRANKPLDRSVSSPPSHPELLQKPKPISTRKSSDGSSVTLPDWDIPHVLKRHFRERVLMFCEAERRRILMRDLPWNLMNQQQQLSPGPAPVSPYGQRHTTCNALGVALHTDAERLNQYYLDNRDDRSQQPVLPRHLADFPGPLTPMYNNFHHPTQHHVQHQVSNPCNSGRQLLSPQARQELFVRKQDGSKCRPSKKQKKA